MPTSRPKPPPSATFLTTFLTYASPGSAGRGVARRRQGQPVPRTPTGRSGGCAEHGSGRDGDTPSDPGRPRWLRHVVPPAKATGVRAWQSRMAAYDLHWRRAPGAARGTADRPRPGAWARGGAEAPPLAGHVVRPTGEPPIGRGSVHYGMVTFSRFDQAVAYILSAFTRTRMYHLPDLLQVQVNVACPDALAVLVADVWNTQAPSIHL